jgi:hypothetical protein
MAQDSSDPTGVRDDSERGNSEVSRARDRKANAALELAMDNHASWIEIAEVLGYPTARAAKVAVEQALERNLQAGDRDHMRRYAATRMERMLRSIWKRTIDEEDPDQLAFIREARGLIGDQVKLWGLAAPSEVVISNPSANEIEAWVAQIHQASTPALEEADIFDIDIVEDE